MGCLTLAVVEYANSWISYGSDTANRWLEGQPTPLVVNGSLQPEGMRKERMHERDVMAELRLRGIEELDKVKRATLETDGEVSVIRQAWAEPVEKGDLDADEAEPKKGKRRPPSPQRRKG
jgi:uncharacterized membrane protein YcaP (DUF421 family)